MGRHATHAMDATPPFDLQRFLDAQAPVWDTVRAELAAGRKRTHWMWFVFPQLAPLGRSATARFYGIAGASEARAYWAHPVLGARLQACCALLAGLHGRSAVEVFGEVDALKLRSCLTLFDAVAPGQPLLLACLQHTCDGQRDPATLRLLAQAP